MLVKSVLQTESGNSGCELDFGCLTTKLNHILCWRLNTVRGEVSSPLRTALCHNGFVKWMQLCPFDPVLFQQGKIMLPGSLVVFCRLREV